MKKISKWFLSIFVGMLVLLPCMNVKALLVGGIDVPVVTSNDGLYADTYESGRHIYKGTNPDNYIYINGEMWRIVSVESNGSVKIIRNKPLDSKQTWSTIVDPWTADQYN